MKLVLVLVYGVMGEIQFFLKHDVINIYRVKLYVALVFVPLDKGLYKIGQKLVPFLINGVAMHKKKNNAYAYPLVVKPVESAGSDDVFKCESSDEVKTAVERICGKVNGLGNINEGALIQEFLRGEEYVVDSVSRDGVHKLIAIWHYDKRYVNQANFVYHGMSLLDGNGFTSTEKEKVLAQKLKQYAFSVLDALKIINGPSHMEVKVDPESLEPCLVEVGARCHGGEGSWSTIARACTGYDQVDATLYAYLDDQKFEQLSSQPPPLIKHGAELFFVSRTSGMIRSIQKATEYISSLPSFAKIEWQLKEGDFAPLTTDCFTRPGSAQLIHTSRDQLAIDCKNIRLLETSSRPAGIPPLLDLEFVCKKPIDRGTVIIVDPYSTGAMLAARVRSHHRKKLLVVHSDPNSPIMNYVAAGTEIRAHGSVMHSNQGCEVTAKDCATAAKGAIVGVLPGAETGVVLADQLADIFATRANPQHLSAARRNKYLMGEAVRKAGVRAVRQAKANNWTQAQGFIKELENQNHAVFPLIVKPIESAGSDDVFKCNSSQEVRQAVERITGKINGLGYLNEGALIQEFLQGDEFVVDAVSRDGIHKITAVWMYDKRSVNGTNFVYFGMQMVDFFGTDKRLTQIAHKLADYSNQVRNALQIFDGPSHMEIKVHPDSLEPCLVEVGARCHGGEGSWLTVADACVGYNQVDVTLDAYLDPDAFDALPLIPNKLSNYGCEVFLVSHHSGIVAETHVDLIRKLRSFAKMELQVQPGSKLKPTIDCFTRPGAVQLIHPDPNVVLADCETIRQLESEGKLFTLEQ
uniref:ATP-grasp domain-containing protein n=1 Tax=Aureoumbra lagunensis TaxID=44058 RepID=A0A7S3JRM9_9STRA|mmetsp:Transcript_16293/g.19788  ORF Transcript_16293/g.19788 Transcript_16293/m.19788 type:complete len:804 (+) Transcript_16293:281-2692(+)